MKINIKKLNRDAETKGNMFTLVNLTIIVDFKKSTKFTRMLEEEYREVQASDWQAKIMLTLINSMITQNRGVFILTKESLLRLIEKDNNHLNKVTLRNNDYKGFINHITNSLISITKYKRFNRDVMVCTVIDKDILKLINANLYIQNNEVKMFITGEVDNRAELIMEIYNRYVSFKVSPPEQNKNFISRKRIENIAEKYKKMK